MLSIEQYGLIEFGFFILTLGFVGSCLYYATSGRRQAQQPAADTQER